MDLEQFYDADPRRRHSEELEFGAEWRAGGARTEVSWIEATGEIYAMRDPLGQLNVEPLGAESVSRVPVEALTVEVLGIVPGRDQAEAVMSGWESAMESGDDSVAWVRDRIAHAATEMTDPPARPSRDLSSD